MKRVPARLLIMVLAALLGALVLAGAAGAAGRARPRHRPALMRVHWMRSYAAPGTPRRYDRVGVLAIGRRSARNVLVFEPGTTAGSAYIVPFAQWLVARMPNWQVWSVERRQNLLEDQSVLTRAKEHRASASAVFDYYLKWLVDPSIKHHIQFAGPSTYAKGWGLNVAMRDLRVVIRAARRLGGKVVLSGHSLGGALVTAYATWNFGGRPGANDLAGLVFDDGASFGAAATAAKARSDLANLEAPKASPWGGIGIGAAPLLGLFSSTGALAAVQNSDQPAIGQTFSALPAILNPGVPVTNLALFAFDTNVSTSKFNVFAIWAHEGKGLGPAGANGVHGWNAAGALTPPKRWATMLAGPGVAGADGVEWYFPARLTMDIADALGNGLASPAQKVLGVHATMGRRLPRRLLMYAFGAAGGAVILHATKQLAAQSHIPRGNLMLINRHATYAHNDPAGAYPRNAFFKGLVRFLGRVDGAR